MSPFSVAPMLVICLSVVLTTCTGGGQHLTRPSPVPNGGSLTSGLASGTSATTSATETPFQIQAILRGDGFGLVRFRQQKNATENIINLHVWVRDLAPNSSYGLQRATDTTLDGVCTGSNWLTLGEGLTPRSIDTDNSGTGQASLFRDLSSLVVGAGFDIYFRVIDSSTDVVLQSDCYRFVIRD